MYYYLSGELTYLEKNLAVVECGGVGYSAVITDKTYEALRPRLNEKVKLFTKLNVREDAMDLFGFISPEEKNSFIQLTSVSGVGPKMAIAILSELSAGEFASAVVSGNVTAFTRASGVGNKIASRIVLELKDKIANQQLEDVTAVTGSVSVPVSGGAAAEAVNALCVLGYSKAEATNAVKAAGCSADASVEDVIRLALKYLM